MSVSNCIAYNDDLTCKTCNAGFIKVDAGCVSIKKA